MNDITFLESDLDSSVNIVKRTDDGGYFEARFVQRKEDTVVVYLSSQSGCQEACRFCHLTQTGQTQKTEAVLTDYLDQIYQVFKIINEQSDISKIENIHFNFMARGDVMNNSLFTYSPIRLISAINEISLINFPKATPRFKLSTIFPKNNDVNLDLFLQDIGFLRLAANIDVEIYYSLYSLKESFRKKWIPKALNPESVGRILSNINDGLRLHHALIAGQNDSEEDVRLIHQWLEDHNLEVMINIVRYNPFDEGSGQESSDEVRAQYIEWMKQSLRVKLIQEISLVGKDIKASCGMFVT